MYSSLKRNSLEKSKTTSQFPVDLLQSGAREILIDKVFHVDDFLVQVQTSAFILITNLDREEESLRELVLEVLGGPKALELPIHHDRETRAQNLAFFHA